MRCDSWDKKIRKKVVLHYFSDCPVVYDGSTFELFPDSEAISDGIKETFDVEVTQDLFLQQGEKGCDEFAAKALINEFSEQDERIKCLVPAGYCFAVIIVGDPGIRYKSWGEPTLIQYSVKRLIIAGPPGTFEINGITSIKRNKNTPSITIPRITRYSLALKK